MRLKPFAVVIALLLGLVGATSETATAAGGGAWTYDVLTLSRFDVRAGGGADSGSAQFTGVRDRSASASVEAIGRSTTFSPRSVATEAASGTRVVIGGMEDLGQGSIGPGEEALASRLPGDTGSRLGNWLNNRDVLQNAMDEGNPIRDASVDSQGNLRLEDTRRFITMERDYLRSFGWTYDPTTTTWNPPG